MSFGMPTPPGPIFRTEEYWRWMIGRRYAHVIWVACLGDSVKGYAFIKDHKILEIAYTTHGPPACLARCWGEFGPEALERAYPEVIVHAPVNHAVIDTIRTATGKVVDQDVNDGVVSMYHIPDLGRFLRCIVPELARRAHESGCPLPLEIGRDQHRGPSLG